MRAKILNIAKLLLLAIFVAYYFGETTFLHIHEEDGEWIVHSHPYSGTKSNPEHTHTTQAFDLIQMITLTGLILVLYFSGSLLNLIFHKL